MKIQELLVEVDQDALDMRNALSDVAMQELQKIEDDPTHYFMQTGDQLSQEQAMDIQQTMGAIDDKTFDLIANSPYIIRSLEDNYNDETGESFISLQALAGVLERAKARIAR